MYATVVISIRCRKAIAYELLTFGAVTLLSHKLSG
jgi:hypothetical protein